MSNVSRGVGPRMSAEDVLTAGRLIARKVCPYFRPMILAFNMVATLEVQTVATTDTAVFLYNPETVATWTPKQTAGAVVHEVLHLWNKHFGRCGDRDPRLYNLAGDLAINPEILALGLELPPGVLFPEMYGFPRGLTADEYYRLLEQYEKRNGPGSANDPNAGSSSQGQGSGPPQRGVGAGQCGSCSGHAHDKEPPKDAPGAPQGRTPTQMDRLAKQTSEAVAEASEKMAGRMPGSWAKLAKESLRPPIVPWREKIARFTRLATQFRAGAAVHRFDGPSRRQAGLGFGAGRPVLPRLRTPIPVVWIVIDTSGSMGPKETSDAIAETQGVLEAVGGEVTLCVCDAEVHGVTPVSDVRQVLGALKGGGGTDFRPAFAAALETSPRPDVIVFITDGYCYPEMKAADEPDGIGVIWALVGAHVNKKVAPWGNVVRVSDKEEDQYDFEDE